MPALLISTSTPPSVVDDLRRPSASARRGRRRRRRSRPRRPAPCAARISSTTSCTRSAPRSTTATRAPSSANRCAVARPMPDAAPVTSTRLPGDRTRQRREAAHARRQRSLPPMPYAARHSARSGCTAMKPTSGDRRAAGREQVEVVVEHAGPQPMLGLEVGVHRGGAPHLQAVALLGDLPVQRDVRVGLRRCAPSPTPVNTMTHSVSPSQHGCTGTTSGVAIGADRGHVRPRAELPALRFHVVEFHRSHHRVQSRTLAAPVSCAEVKKPTVAERRAEILEITCRWSSSAGFAATRIADVAKRLGVSSSLIHYHFDSKEQLLAEAFAHYARKDVAEMEAEIEAAPTSVAQLDRVVHNYVPEGSDDVEWMLWIDGWGEALRNPMMRKISQELDEQSAELLERVIRKGVETRRVRVRRPGGRGDAPHRRRRRLGGAVRRARRDDDPRPVHRSRAHARRVGGRPRARVAPRVQCHHRASRSAVAPPPPTTRCASSSPATATPSSATTPTRSPRCWATDARVAAGQADRGPRRHRRSVRQADDGLHVAGADRTQRRVRGRRGRGHRHRAGHDPRAVPDDEGRRRLHSWACTTTATCAIGGAWQFAERRIEVIDRG